MNRVSLKQIANAIEDICIQTRKEYADHLQVKSYSFGNVSTINTQEIKGVHLHLQPTSSPIERNISNFTFNIYVMDLIDEDNLLDVMNDTAEIIVDMLKKLSSSQFKSEYSFKMINSATIDPFEGAFEQLTAGFVSTITFEVYNGTTCTTGFQKYYDMAYVVGKAGDTNFDIDVSYGSLRNMISAGDPLYLSDNGESETIYYVTAVSWSSTTGTRINFTEVIPSSASLDKVRLKNK